MLFALIFDDIFPTTDNKERVQKKGGRGAGWRLHSLGDFFAALKTLCMS